MQPLLFHETLTDALREVVRAVGGTKKVGALMRPEKSAEEAGRWLADCLNPDRREKLDPDQVLWLIKRGREVGCNSIISFIASEAHYEQPRPIEPEDERARLQREFVSAVAQFQKIAQALDRAGIPSGLKVVG